MNKEEILGAIDKTIKGQGSAVDIGGKLAAILESIVNLIPAEQVNSDWNATEGPAEILNKPTIPAGPVIIEGTVDSNDFTPLDGQPSFDNALAAFRQGRVVILMADNEFQCIIRGNAIGINTKTWTWID